MWAFFQSVGTSPVSREYWYSLVRIGANWLAAGFKIKAGTSSGLVALCIFSSRRSLRTPFQCTRIESIVGWSRVPYIVMFDLSSLVYAETNWSFKISTFELLSLWMKPSLFFSGATPVGSCRFLLMYDQNTFRFSFRSLLTISSMYSLWVDLMSFCACIFTLVNVYVDLVVFTRIAGTSKTDCGSYWC